MTPETEDITSRPPAPILYVTDLTYDRYDPADLFDLAYLIRSPDHDLRGVCLTTADGEGERILDALTTLAGGGSVPPYVGISGLRKALADAPAGINLVVVGGYGVVAELLASDRASLREKGARLFLVGGHANDYASGSVGDERLPIDPRLKQRNPERFAPGGDPRVGAEQRAAWASLLISGEGVIWLPRDICLWRYAAPGVLADGGRVAEFLLRELFYANLGPAGETNRYDAADAPVVLSALPALLLAVQPDPFAWMRLFRVVTARVEADADGAITLLSTRTDTPNLYAVIAIDGTALGKLLTTRLRDRPLPGNGHR